MKKKRKVAVRRSWGVMSPVTKVLDSKKKYKRAKAKRDFKKDMDL